MKLDKEVYKYVDYELLHFDDNKKKLQEMKEDIIESSPEPPDGMPKGNQTGNPTERKTIRIISSVAILKIENTVNAIERVYFNLSVEYKQFFDTHYIRKYGIVKTCQENFISERTYYNMRDRIIKQVAEEMGLI